MKELLFSNVRCFSTFQRVPLAPLTILVGENNTGKTTFLGMMKIAYRIPFSYEHINFNEPPFNLGNYMDIAHREEKKSAKSFKIGFSVGFEKKFHEGKGKIGDTIDIIGTFKEKDNDPILKEVLISCQPYVIKYIHTRKANRIEYMAPSGKEILQFDGQYGELISENMPDRMAFNQFMGGLQAIIQLTQLIQEEQKRKGKAAKRKLSKDDYSVIFGIILSITNLKLPISFAPIRTKPSRDYVYISEDYNVEGTHIPFKLAALTLSNPKRFQEIRKKVRQFGKACGLFLDIELESFKKSKYAPFRILIKIGKGKYNIMDMGYGISQILPILVEISSRDMGMFLIQQPEIHLHPRAQAELGTYLSKLINPNRQYIVETHSDYLIDRIRIEVRKGILKPEDIIILFFDWGKENEIKIYPIPVDKMGNLIDAPLSYRKFFLDEQKNLLFGGKN